MVSIPERGPKLCPAQSDIELMTKQQILGTEPPFEGWSRRTPKTSAIRPHEARQRRALTSGEGPFLNCRIRCELR
jgi:hypothetical protein